MTIFEAAPPVPLGAPSKSAPGRLIVKRWLLGTHQGAVSRDHLAYYLDEFTFRFNRRRSRSRGKLFYRLLQQAVAISPEPYKGIVGGTWNQRQPQHIGATGVN